MFNRVQSKFLWQFNFTPVPMYWTPSSTCTCDMLDICDTSVAISIGFNFCSTCTLCRYLNSRLFQILWNPLVIMAGLNGKWQMAKGYMKVHCDAESILSFLQFQKFIFNTHALCRQHMALCNWIRRQDDLLSFFEPYFFKFGALLLYCTSTN